MVTKFSDIYEKIIPFFQKYPIVGVKALDYADFCKAAELMKIKAHLTASGLEQIGQLKTGINRGRKMSTWARPQINPIRKDLELIGGRRAVDSESLGVLVDFSDGTSKPYKGRYVIKRLSPPSEDEKDGDWDFLRYKLVNKIELLIILREMIKRKRLLIKGGGELKPVPLRTVTGLTLCKSTNLPDIEMIRGPKHVSKALNNIKYIYLRGKILYIQAFIIMLLQNYILASKILETKCNYKCVEKRSAHLSPWLLNIKRVILLKQ